MWCACKCERVCVYFDVFNCVYFPVDRCYPLPYVVNATANTNNATCDQGVSTACSHLVWRIIFKDEPLLNLIIRPCLHVTILACYSITAHFCLQLCQWIIDTRRPFCLLFSLSPLTQCLKIMGHCWITGKKTLHVTTVVASQVLELLSIFQKTRVANHEWNFFFFESLQILAI